MSILEGFQAMRYVSGAILAHLWYVDRASRAYIPQKTSRSGPWRVLWPRMLPFRVATDIHFGRFSGELAHCFSDVVFGVSWLWVWEGPGFEIL